MQPERRSPLKRILIGIVLGAVVGVLIAPVVGMWITGDSATMSGKEQGFVGFLYGVYWGPAVGALVGALLAWRCAGRSRP